MKEIVRDTIERQIKILSEYGKTKPLDLDKLRRLKLCAEIVDIIEKVIIPPKENETLKSLKDEELIGLVNKDRGN